MLWCIEDKNQRLKLLLAFVNKFKTKFVNGAFLSVYT